jgi:acyl-coenzyme A thioesterase PaaI-like protein
MTAVAEEPTTHPPAEHVARDLHVAYRFVTRHRMLLTIPVVPHILHDDGTVRTEVLATVIDEATGSISVYACLPDWGSTAALTIGATGEAIEPEGELELSGEVMKAGKRLVFVGAEVRWNDVLVAYARGEFARVTRTHQDLGFDAIDPDPEQVHALGLPTSGLDRAYPERLGMERVDATAGILEMPFEEYTRNSAGILHGGVLGGLSLAAAEAASGGRVSIANLQYLSAGRVGPFRTGAARWYEHDGSTVWKVEARDLGDTSDDADGRVMVSAVVTTTGGAR